MELKSMSAKSLIKIKMNIKKSISLFKEKLLIIDAKLRKKLRKSFGSHIERDLILKINLLPM
jgi:hypothetical protein